MMKLGIISLGCSKNLVDTENFLGRVKQAGFVVTNDAAEADVIAVNTCGFITSAKEESINTILEMAKYKQTGRCRYLVAFGCLTERYPDELREEIPEIDLLWGVHDQDGLVKKLCELTGELAACKNRSCERVLTTPAYRAYLRIADGCDNCCTYCAIPLIRGGRKSVPMDELVAEAEKLAARGVRELTVIAQDTSAYGADLYGKPMLKELLLRLAEIDGFVWIRVLYSYPNTVTEELVDAMAGNAKLVNYIDMPIQHIAPDMLVRMNRHGSAEHIRHITDYIRSKYEDFILRTTVMTGFPGETEEEISQLAEFLRKHPFDRVGAFAYSEEDGTEAALMEDRIDESVKQERLDMVMREQAEISLALNKKRIGRTYDVLVESVEGSTAFGRSYAEAPDVDGMIKISLKSEDVKPGGFIRVRISEAGIYDLVGEEV